MNSTFDVDNTTDDSTFGSSTFAASPQFQQALNSTFTSSPNNKTLTRERQKTMVVESNIIKEIKDIFARAKLSNEELNVSQLEASILSSVQRFENESIKRIKEAEHKHESDLLIANGLIEEFYNNSERLLSSIENGRIGAAGIGTCDGVCATSAKLKLDLDAAHSELEDRYNEFMKLYDSFQKVRKASSLQKDEYVRLEQVVHEERGKHKELKAKFHRLKESATSQLTQASDDVNRIEREHEEKTLGMRLRVKQLETAVQLKDQEIEIKKREVEQLREIVNTLMKEVQPLSDGESERE